MFWICSSHSGMVEPLETLVSANLGVSLWPGLSSFLGLRPWTSLLPLPHFKIRSHLELQLSSEIQSWLWDCVAEVARNGLFFTLIRKKDTAAFLNSMGQCYFDSHQLLFRVPNQLLLPSCRCSDTQLAQGRKQVAKKSTSFRPGSVGSGHSSPSSPVLGDTPAAGRALPAPQHR